MARVRAIHRRTKSVDRCEDKLRVFAMLRAIPRGIPQRATRTVHLALVLLTSLMLGLVLPASASAVTKNGFDLSNSTLDSKDIKRGGQDKDGIFALTYPNFIPAKESQLAGCECVLGVNLGGVSKPYPLSKLREYGKPCFTDELACQSIHIEWDDANNSAWITDTGGEAMASLTIFWFAWFTVHPETQIFEFIDNAKLKACQL